MAPLRHYNFKYLQHDMFCMMHGMEYTFYSPHMKIAIDK